MLEYIEIYIPRKEREKPRRKGSQAKTGRKITQNHRSRQ
jgi:hypothetical protein